MSNKLPKQQPTMRMKAVERAEAARAAQAAAEHKRRRTWWIVGGVVGALLVGAITAAVVVSSGEAEPEVLPSATARELGCSSCHSVNGARSEGPTWQGLYGSDVILTDGSVVTADEDYLRRAVLDPAAQVREGFQPSMPTVAVTDEQLDALIEEIEALAD